MCGNLTAAIADIEQEELDKPSTIVRIFKATGRDLQKMGEQITSQQSEAEMLKQEVATVKENVAEIKAEVAEIKGKVETMSGVVNELLGMVKDHFNSKELKEQVVGNTIISLCRTKKFWLVVLLTCGILILSGIGVYHLAIAEPDVVKTAITVAAGL